MRVLTQVLQQVVLIDQIILFHQIIAGRDHDAGTRGCGGDGEVEFECGLRAHFPAGPSGDDRAPRRPLRFDYSNFGETVCVCVCVCVWMVRACARACACACACARGRVRLRARETMRPDHVRTYA